MIVLAVAAISLAMADPPPAAMPLSEAAHALEAGRVDQARTMIANAVKAGAQGPALDRLLADLAFASGDFAGALPRYQALLVANPGDARLYERAGIAAIHIRDIVQAERLLDKATSLPGASWRAWNALGVAADYKRDWPKADAAYGRALAAAPNRAEVLNNLGWSKLVRGEWAEAAALLERAAVADPKSKRVADNLELAKAAIAEALPQRMPGESDGDWAARLNDAGMIARVQGNRKKAIAAFAQAIEARSEWFERAANNLALVEAAK
jgi:Flp pilus assembly protein TadD